MSAILWHDLECGPYREDLGLWRELADSHGEPVLDVGAGTGRVTLELARAGHEVTALDHDGELLGELRRRAAGLPVDAVVADACGFSLGKRFALCVVPMQTVQLLDGPKARAEFLRCVAAHLLAGGAVAIAISEALEPFAPDGNHLLPLPDICEREGTVHCSQPTAVRVRDGGYTLERRREVIDPAGGHTVSTDLVHLDALTAQALEREALAAGLRARERRRVAPTSDYAGSTVVVLGA